MKMKKTVAGESQVTGTEDQAEIPERLLRFLNSMPTTCDPMEWVIQLKEALLELLSDVDKVAVYVNSNSTILNSPMTLPFNFIGNRNNMIMHVGQRTQMNETGNSIAIEVDVVYHSEGILENYLQQMRRSGLPFDDYQQPIAFEYGLHPQNYHLGVIFLFRRQGLSPISAQTLEIMNNLHSFFLFTLSDFATRYRYSRPADAVFVRLITILCEELKFTAREKEVLTYRLLGLQIDDVAQRMYLTPYAIKCHIKSIHRKAGVGSFHELFMGYLAPDAEEMELLLAALEAEYRVLKKNQRKDSSINGARG